MMWISKYKTYFNIHMFRYTNLPLFVWCKFNYFNIKMHLRNITITFTIKMKTIIAEIVSKTVYTVTIFEWAKPIIFIFNLMFSHSKLFKVHHQSYLTINFWLSENVDENMWIKHIYRLRINSREMVIKLNSHILHKYTAKLIWKIKLLLTSSSEFF